MSPRPEYLRLCLLLNESLQPFSDIAFDSLTEETERDLLIALSKVLRQVKQWTRDFDSDEEELVEPVDNREFSVSSTSQLDNRHCFAEIIGDLMFLLAVDSRYVQHLAGNILVAISEFLLTSDCGWDDFTQLLCLCLELAICNGLISSSGPGALNTRYLDYEPATSRSLLKRKLKGASWSVVAAIFRVLHKIHKYLKQEFDYKIMKAYLDSVSSLMLNIQWDTLRVGHNTEAVQGSDEDVPLQTKIVKSKETIVFFGSFIQFLCSLVGQSGFLDYGDVFTLVICRIVNLVPKLAAWCHYHTELQSPHSVHRISHYFRHKVLMLMVKLSSIIHIEQTIHAWMDLVHKYFQDLLLQSIYGDKSDQDKFLEGSPFCTSICDPGKQYTSSRHLQRLAVFLFLKCSLNLISTDGRPDEPQCAYQNLKPNCTTNLNSDSECRSESIGLAKIHEWLQAHIDADILANGELYYDGCVRFSLSFLQLFMHEDDILFEMLLLLFRIPFYPERWIIKGKPLADVENHLTFLPSDMCNPVHIFHLFLAEIHYDHQVLLDYLISKDTGSSCAEYLLRSLRIVCDSWSLFVEFPGVEEGSRRLCPKRQKVLVDGTDSKEHNGRRGCRNSKRPFAAARDCLVSLKTSIDSLNQKNLFPYNPQVLLRRLMRFQELCMKQ